ncbi:MAG: protease modulator HflC, partial [Planctomycetes bacterium]|nr:protease modulator HflC [Planctomycetota bacterium]
MRRRRKALAIAIAAAIAAVLVLHAVTFQVREIEDAIVTTFGKPGAAIRGSEPGGAGLYWKWPWPIQRVRRYDNRLRHIETRLEQIQANDGKPVLVSSYLLWRIADPLAFYARVGTDERARDLLQDRLRAAQNAVIGRRAFAELLAPEGEAERLETIEQEILDALRADVGSNYAADVHEVGIQEIRLPEATTIAVFERMRRERERIAAATRAEGEKRAAEIRADADKERDKILAQAEGEAQKIRAEGDAEAAKSYATFAREPELAILLAKIDSLKELAAERTTWFFDLREAPFDVLRAVMGEDAGRAAAPDESGSAAAA